MSSSRLKLMGKTDGPVVGPTGESANSRTFQQLMANTYKPGFIDKTDTESFKMSVDYELAEISKALFKTSERESNIIIDTEEAKKVVDELKVEVDGNKAAITEVKEVTIENGKATAKLEVTVESNYQETTAKITKTDTTVAELDRATAESIRKLEAEISGGGGSGSITEKLEVLADRVDGISTEWSITSDVNGKVAGVQLLNGTGKKSEFNVLADVFKVSHDAEAGVAPFEIIGGKTLIKNAVVGDIASDNWISSGTTGWAISKNGHATFNNVTVRGNVEANAGVMDNVRIKDNCIIEGTAKIGDAQVDTLQIAGSAVTIPIFKEVTFTPPYPQIGNQQGDYDAGCITENIIYNDPAKVLFMSSGVVQGNGHTNFGVLMRIWFEGKPFAEKRMATTASGGNTISTPFITDFELPHAGTYAFEVRPYDDWSSGSIDLKQLSMTVIGIKR
ncbi:MAG: phage tail tip fiber protein [Bacteroidales bacterium]